MKTIEGVEVRSLTHNTLGGKKAAPKLKDENEDE
jgi:hypothetical protein